MKFSLAACVFAVGSGIIAPPSRDVHVPPSKLNKHSGHRADDGDVEKTPKDVILFMGQSNCVGQAKLADLEKLDKMYLEPPNNMLFAKDDTTNGGVEWPQWTPDANDGSPSGHFGPEVGFGHFVSQMYKNEKFAIKKISTSSTSLAHDWLKSYQDGEPLSSKALNWMERLRKTDECDEGRCRLKAIMWIQGEEDSMHPDMSKKYRDNLAIFFKLMRNSAKDDELPVFILELPSTGWTMTPYHVKGTTEIREAQAAFVKSDSRSVLIPGLDMGSIEGKHYDARLQIEMGKRFADSFREYFS